MRNALTTLSCILLLETAHAVSGLSLQELIIRCANPLSPFCPAFVLFLFAMTLSSMVAESVPDKEEKYSSPHPMDEKIVDAGQFFTFTETKPVFRRTGNIDGIQLPAEPPKENKPQQSMSRNRPSMYDEKRRRESRYSGKNDPRKAYGGMEGGYDDADPRAQYDSRDDPADWLRRKTKKERA